MKVKIIASIAAAAILAAVGSARATFHEWLPEEIFSNASGTVQYIEFSNTFDLENLLSSTSITAATTGNTYHFPTNLASSSTSGHKLLVATPGYAALPGVPTPDYVLPSNNFFSITGDSVHLIGTAQPFLTFTSGQLPTDGHTALFFNGTTLSTGLSSPTNFAGVSGTVAVPETTTLALLVGSGGLLLCRRSRRNG